MEQMQLGERKVLHLKLDAIYTFLLLDVFGELSCDTRRGVKRIGQCSCMAQFLALLPEASCAAQDIELELGLAEEEHRPNIIINTYEADTA